MIDYSSVLSSRVREVEPSGIRKFFDIAEQFDDVISLSVGDPDFKTPWNIRREGMRTLERGFTRYTANSGLLQLRKELSRYLKRKYNLNYTAEEEIIVTVGGSEAIDLAIRALVEPGDEVLIVEPCFVSYRPIVQLTGGVPVSIPTKAENHFKLTADELRQAITPKTKLLVLPFPNNPTGAVLRRHEMEAIADVLRETNIMVLSDEIYAELTYGKERHVSFAAIEGMWERTITINGFSKAFSMTGWRLGYAAAPAPVLKEMFKIHQFAIMCAPTTSQYAAIEALKNGDESVEEMRQEYDTRRRLVIDGFTSIGLPCFEPEGAFYVFPSIKSTGMTSMDFCEKLLYDQKVAVVPGTAFGESGEGFIRVSYSYSKKHLLEAIERIDTFLKGR